jgi:hypothetical protein
MKKKKRRSSCKAEVRIPFPNMLAVFLVCVTVLGLSYVWFSASCNTLGNEITRLESAYRAACRSADIEQERWANMLAPANFERALQRHSLAMTLPGERQIVRVRRGSDGQVSRMAYIQ